jgi:AraC family transcriptional regulator
MSCDPEFFDGHVIHWRELNGVLLGEIAYRPGARRALHAHKRACLHLNLEGGYVEKLGSREWNCTQLAAAFQPPGHEHAYRCHDVATRAFTIEFGESWLKRLHEIGVAPRPGLLHHSLVDLVLRLRSEYRVCDSASQLCIEGLLLEILAGAARQWSTERTRREPQWLRTVDGILRERFTETLTLDDLAATTGMHPVHIARTFRAYRGTSVGAFVRQLRVARACDMLAERDRPLADIAVELGFFDQSQFTRVFRRSTGVPPGRYRNTAASRPR